MKRFVVLVTISLFTLSANARQPNTNARQVIDKMMDVYAKCDSYLDTGDTNSDHSMKGKVYLHTKKPFTTAFQRAGFFRYEYIDGVTPQGDINRYIVWQADQDIKMWSFLERASFNMTSLRLALPVPISDLSGYYVPYLLMPTLNGPRNKHSFLNWDSIDLRGTETIDGRVAYIISGTFRDPMTPEIEKKRTLWIDCDNSLLLRVKMSFAVVNEMGESVGFESIAGYKPQMNIQIPAEAFRFNPPAN